MKIVGNISSKKEAVDIEMIAKISIVGKRARKLGNDSQYLCSLFGGDLHE